MDTVQYDTEMYSIRQCIEYDRVSFGSRKKVTMSQTVKRRRAATRERLLDAAREVLAEEGIQGSSVEVICDRAGFTRGAFYSNFDSKEDLVFCVFDREKERLLGHLRQAVAEESEVPADDPEALVARVVDTFLTLQATDRISFLVHSEFALHGIRDSEVGAVYTETMCASSDELGRAIDEVLALLGRRLTADRSHVIALIVGAFEYVERDALIDGRDWDRSILTETLPRVLLALTEPLD